MSSHAALNVVLALVLALFVPAAGAVAQEVDPAEQARIDRLWNRYWREVAPFYVKHGESFVCVPGYDRRLPGSAGITAADYQRQTARAVEYKDENGRARTRTEVKPDAEAQAAVQALSPVEPGIYGHILSGSIKQIVDSETVILEDIWLVDAGQVRTDKAQAEQAARREAWGEVENRFRDFRDGRRNRGDTIADEATDLMNYINFCFADREALAERQRDRLYSRTPWRIVGYQTRTLTAGNRWPADQTLQLVILSVTNNEVLAIPAAKIGTGLSELEFLDMLASRTMTKAQFVDLYTQVRRDHRTDYLPVILAAMEGWEIDQQQGGDPDNGAGEVQLVE